MDNTRDAITWFNKRLCGPDSRTFSAAEGLTLSPRAARVSSSTCNFTTVSISGVRRRPAHAPDDRTAAAYSTASHLKTKTVCADQHFSSGLRPRLGPNWAARRRFYGRSGWRSAWRRLSLLSPSRSERGPEPKRHAHSPGRSTRRRCVSARCTAKTARSTSLRRPRPAQVCRAAAARRGQRRQRGPAPA